MSAVISESTISPVLEKAVDTTVAAVGNKKKFGIPFWVAATWLFLLTFCAIFGGFLPIRKTNDPDFLLGANIGVGNWTSTFTKQHWLGVDENGNDLLAYAIKGSKVSLTVGFGTVLLAFLVGGWGGMVAGYFRGRFDSVLTFLTNCVLSIPALLLLLLLVSVLSAQSGAVSVWKFILTLGGLSVPIIFRVVRAATLQQAAREYVTAARAMGAKNSRVLIREILPNVVKPAMAFALVAVGSVMVVEGSLSFLGAGLSGNTISWGRMLQGAAGLGKLKSGPHATFVPAGFLFLTVLSLNFIGDKVRERLEVKQGGI
jgi:peptide/nickel transport system permease protein